MTQTADSTASGQNVGYGQQQPATANSRESVVEFQIKAFLAQLEKMKLVKVTAVHGGGNSVAAAGTVDVQLLVCQIDSKGNKSDQGIVYGVPWFRAGGAAGSVVVDPKVDDLGYVVCEDRDITNVKSAIANGASPVNVMPGTRRQNSVSDGVYMGMDWSKDAPVQYLWFKPDGGYTLKDKFGNKIDCDGSSLGITDKAGNVVTLGGGGIGLTPVSGQPVTVNGDLNVTGDVKAKSGGGTFVTLSQHQHTANNTPPTPGH